MGISRDGVPDRRYGRTPATAPGPSGPQMLTSFGAIRRNPLQYLRDSATEFGPVVQFPIPRPPSYLVTDVDAVRRVLVGNARLYDKHTLQYRSLSLVTGDGLLAADGEIWRRQRRLVQPAFHHEAIRSVVDHTADALERLDSRWAALRSRGEILDLDDVVMRSALEIVGASLFGASLATDAHRLTDATLSALDVVVARSRVPVTPPEWVPTPANRKLTRAVRTLDDAVAAMVAQRRREGGIARDRDMLDLLLAGAADGDALSPEEVRNQIVTFIVAGHETVASALTWALWLISGDESAQQRLADEARDALGDRRPTLEDLARLPYARAVFDEALRLYPPAWLITRRALAADVLGGREIPAGALVIMSPYLVHRDPAVWPDPEEFQPERFLDQRVRGGDGSGAYLPFGAGPRLCIGREFAYLEGTLLLAGLARSVRLRRDRAIPAPRAVPLVTIRPDRGLPLVVTRRD
jgi:cytochrome P450